jgi:glutamine amidotransferase
MVTIIDYGAGNIKSIMNMLKRIGEDCIITNDYKMILNAEKIILPGVGHFNYGMKKLKEYNLVNALNEVVINKKKPILGICLGAQLMCKFSAEGNIYGLNWFDVNVQKFERDKLMSKYKIPHMGWNHITDPKYSALYSNMGFEKRFYFVHSFHFVTEDQSIVLSTTTYGYDFVSALHHQNIYAVQFHPEKSHRYGLKLMENFIKL